MNDKKLNLLWTNADPVASELMVMMYAYNAMKKSLWEEVRVIVWGATAKLVAEDVHIQKLVAEAQEQGVEFSACAACADQLGVKSQLEQLGIEIIFWGVPLTEIIKSGEHLITV
ncbi:DsrE family protein [Maridesulfovibrio sp.]|uniref:DsrE family protein n=1 Tax=Maridesulfovibrio sp. TaxID=2795000 RepID=UPI002A1885BF|nr:DsrE family protein [Maridesulfovibrio sp.]